MILPLQTGTENEILRAKSARVTSFDKKLKKLVADMKETMLAADGVGLAAPQIGQNIRVITILFQADKHTCRQMEMINPEIIETSCEYELGEEGCLSIPGEWGKVDRPACVTIRFQDASGREQTLQMNELNSRVVQHEIDHLDGVLFVDRI